MPQLNSKATQYAAQYHNMSVPEYITWRALGGTCGDDVSEEILENSQVISA